MTNPDRTVEVEWNGARYVAREDAFGVLTIPAGARPLGERAIEAEKSAPGFHSARSGSNVAAAAAAAPRTPRKPRREVIEASLAG